jgi:hypothetical protein
MIMDRIEEFAYGGKSFIFFDLSNFKSNDEFTELIEAAKPIVRKYAERSLYTITNIKNLRFDTTTKRIVADWMSNNKPYIAYGAVIGVDSIKQIMLNAVFALSGRRNMHIASTKEEAIEWLLLQS